MLPEGLKFCFKSRPGAAKLALWPVTGRGTP